MAVEALTCALMPPIGRVRQRVPLGPRYAVGDQGLQNPLIGYVTVAS